MGKETPQLLDGTRMSNLCTFLKSDCGMVSARIVHCFA